MSLPPQLDPRATVDPSIAALLTDLLLLDVILTRPSGPSWSGVCGTAGVPPGRTFMDAIQLLTDQHREADAAFDEYLSLGSDDEERKKTIARKVVTDLSVHAGIEEVAFYPTVREALPDVNDDIQEDLEEHRQAKELLSDIQGMDPNDPDFDATFNELIQDVRHHVEEEENDLFPRVRQALTADELEELGSSMQDLMDKVPTNPHPHAPQEPPANKVAGPTAGVLDRLRDRIRQRIDKDTV